ELETIALPFNHSLDLEGVSFSYLDGQEVLSGVDLQIRRGTRVGFVGTTGSGKSTLIDIIMGLLRPTAGTLRADGILLDDQKRKAWQRNIAHVSQVIFLSDATIAQNIAFGVP